MATPQHRGHQQGDEMRKLIWLAPAIALLTACGSSGNNHQAQLQTSWMQQDVDSRQVLCLAWKTTPNVVNDEMGKNLADLGITATEVNTFLKHSC